MKMNHCKDFITAESHDRSNWLLRSVAMRLRRLLFPLGRGAGEKMYAIAGRNRSANPHTMESGEKFTHLPANSRPSVRCKPILAACAFSFVFLFCLDSGHVWAQQDSQQEMRGLDEQVQEIKSDVLSIAAELKQLEEKLLYPSGTQVAIFVALAEGEQMRLDAVRLQIDGQLVAHYIYSAKELEALRKGGMQRIYVGNVATGDHQLEVLFNSKLESGADFSPTEHFTFRKEVKPKLVELTLAGPDSGSTPIALGEQ
jgi:hypothetical protein